MPALNTYPILPQPPDVSVSVWRYLDFAKFATMLKDRALYFTRLDAFGDQFEGTATRRDVELFTRIASDAVEAGDFTADQRDNLFSALTVATRSLRLLTYVNCWHMNSVESEAMWELYTRSEFAVAIKSTYRQVAELLSTSEEVAGFLSPRVGIVQYKNYETEHLPLDVLASIMHKRSAFQHESECRAVMHFRDEENTGSFQGTIARRPLGVNIPIALEALINEVIVAPSAPLWFSETVQHLTFRYGFPTLSVRSSSLLDKPYL